MKLTASCIPILDDQVLALLRECELPDTGNMTEKRERFRRFIGVVIDIMAEEDDNH